MSEFEDGKTAERERIVGYLRYYEASSRRMAREATADASREYQTTIANAMKAMAEAIAGGYQWNEGWIAKAAEEKALAEQASAERTQG